MTPLRQKMINKMILRCFAPSTQEAYLHSATQYPSQQAKSFDLIAQLESDDE